MNTRQKLHQLRMNEFLLHTFVTISFYTIGNKYQIYLGVPAEEAVTTVIYKNAETGEELARTDSNSMQ